MCFHVSIGCSQSLNLQLVFRSSPSWENSIKEIHCHCFFGCFCSLNFGVPMVVYSKGKVIHAKEVLAAGPQPQPIMETVVITLMHLALHSERIELEVNYWLWICFLFSFIVLYHLCLGNVFLMYDTKCSGFPFI